mmetsp:Transcript_58944/g.155020  ORF Transcript_58944/g.155020 Transcript_58944/m.155020 type:complete len:236 (+) Transcript_58944:253-960(+)
MPCSCSFCRPAPWSAHAVDRGGAARPADARRGRHFGPWLMRDGSRSGSRRYFPVRHRRARRTSQAHRRPQRVISTRRSSKPVRSSALVSPLLFARLLKSDLWAVKMAFAAVPSPSSDLPVMNGSPSKTSSRSAPLRPPPAEVAPSSWPKISLSPSRAGAAPSVTANSGPGLKIVRVRRPRRSCLNLFASSSGRSGTSLLMYSYSRWPAKSVSLRPLMRPPSIATPGLSRKKDPDE